MPKKLHYAQFTGCGVLDMVRAVDIVQKHTEKHVLTEHHLKKAVAILQAFMVYSPNVMLRVISDCVPEWFKYPVPATFLYLSPAGGFVRRDPAPVLAHNGMFRMYVMTVSPCPLGMPRDIYGLRRVADTERWEL
jgi:hypothetical protein